MVSVTARKVRDHSGERSSVGVGRLYTGYLISYPIVGRGMVIFRDPHGHRMITTPVKRVLSEPDSNKLYVETENSVYRLEIHGEPLFPMAKPGTGEAASMCFRCDRDPALSSEEETTVPRWTAPDWIGGRRKRSRFARSIDRKHGDVRRLPGRFARLKCERPVAWRLLFREGMSLTVRFWGVRGSVPSPGPQTAAVGGNTSCVELRFGDQIIALDAGTGLRGLGERLVAGGRPVSLSILFSHVHCVAGGHEMVTESS